MQRRALASRGVFRRKEINLVLVSETAHFPKTGSETSGIHHVHTAVAERHTTSQCGIRQVSLRGAPKGINHMNPGAERGALAGSETCSVNAMQTERAQ